MGCCCLDFDSYNAIHDIIKDGENGFLVKNVDDFAGKLRILMQDKDLRIKMGEKAWESVKQYSKENVISMWVDLIEEVTK